MDPDADALAALQERLARMKRDTQTGRERERETSKDARRLVATAIAGRDVNEGLRRALADLIEVPPDL